MKGEKPIFRIKFSKQSFVGFQNRKHQTEPEKLNNYGI